MFEDTRDEDDEGNIETEELTLLLSLLEGALLEFAGKRLTLE